MQVWVATLSRHGPHPADQHDWIREHAPLWLSFGDDVVRSDSWASPANGMQLHTWDNGQDHVDCRIGVGPDGGAVATSGHVLAGGELVTSSQLAQWWSQGRSPAEQVLELGGIFSICSCEGDRRIRAWSSRGRLDAVFYSTGADLVAVSNRPAAAHLVSRRATAPTYDPVFGVQMISCATAAGWGTPYQGGHQVPELTELRVTPAGIQLVGIADERLPTPCHDAVTKVTDALTEAVSFIGGLDTVLGVSLSGGKDSRLVAALLAHSGAQFRATTSGLADHPDVVIGTKVAETLGIDHRVVPPPGDEDAIHVDVGTRLYGVARGSQGMLAAWDAPPGSLRPVSRSGISMGGAGGEVLRGGLAKQPGLTAEKMSAGVRWRMLQNAHLLTREARQVREQELHEWLRRMSHVPPAETLAWFYLELRLGRWNMASRMAQGGRLAVAPFLDSQALRWALATPIDDRTSERAFYSVLERIDPRLAQLPLAESQWRFTQDPAPTQAPQPSRWGRLRRAAQRRLRPDHVPAATPATASAPGPFNWRTQLSGQLGTELVGRVVESPVYDDLTEIVDRAAFDRFCAEMRAGHHDNKTHSATFLWALASVAELWSDTWRGPPPQPHTIAIPRPPPRP